jgi:hypothetical protein
VNHQSESSIKKMTTNRQTTTDTNNNNDNNTRNTKQLNKKQINAQEHTIKATKRARIAGSDTDQSTEAEDPSQTIIKNNVELRKAVEEMKIVHEKANQTIAQLQIQLEGQKDMAQATSNEMIRQLRERDRNAEMRDQRAKETIKQLKKQLESAQNGTAQAIHARFCSLLTTPHFLRKVFGSMERNQMLHLRIVSKNWERNFNLSASEKFVETLLVSHEWDKHIPKAVLYISYHTTFIRSLWETGFAVWWKDSSDVEVTKRKEKQYEYLARVFGVKTDLVKLFYLRKDQTIRLKKGAIFRSTIWLRKYDAANPWTDNDLELIKFYAQKHPKTWVCFRMSTTFKHEVEMNGASFAAIREQLLTLNPKSSLSDI